MPVTKESEGRLNAFPKEPQIEMIENQSSGNNGSRVFQILGVLLLIGLIFFSFTIN